MEVELTREYRREDVELLFGGTCGDRGRQGGGGLHGPVATPGTAGHLEIQLDGSTDHRLAQTKYIVGFVWNCIFHFSIPSSLKKIAGYCKNMILRKNFESLD